MGSRFAANPSYKFGDNQMVAGIIFAPEMIPVPNGVKLSVKYSRFLILAMLASGGAALEV